VCAVTLRTQSNHDADPVTQPMQAAGAFDRALALGALHVVICLAAFTMWAAADAWQQLTQLRVAGLLSVCTAIVAGITVVTVMHEWGHYAGVLLCGVRHTVSQSLGRIVFHFDYERIPLRSYVFASWCGQAGSWFAVILLSLVVPLDTAGREMLACAAIGTAVFVGLVEVPIIVRTWQSREPLLEMSKLDRPTQYLAIMIAMVFALAVWFLV
jgi:hypothetical protein